MTDRSRLHITKLEDFKEWLIKDGWVIEEPKGTWEVLRARKENRRNPLIIYFKMNAKEHLSVMDRDSGVIGAFLRNYKKPQTNADRIRSMGDEELADYIFGVSVGNAPCVLCSEECDFCELTDEECKAKTLAWLQSEVKEGE